MAINEMALLLKPRILGKSTRFLPNRASESNILEAQSFDDLMI